MIYQENGPASSAVETPTVDKEEDERVLKLASWFSTAFVKTLLLVAKHRGRLAVAELVDLQPKTFST